MNEMKVKKISILSKEDLENSYYLGNKECFATDLARLKACSVSEKTGYAEYWIEPDITNKKSRIFNSISESGEYSSCPAATSAGIRIAIDFDDIENFDINNIDKLNLEYPSNAITGNCAEMIGELFKRKSKHLLKTGRQYCVDDEMYEEYSIFDTKFIILKNTIPYLKLGDGTIKKRDDLVYLAINKIPFIVDENRKKLYSKNVIYNDFFSAVNHGFAKSKLAAKMNNEFLKSINDQLEHKKEEPVFASSYVEKKNRYNFNFEPVSEEDIIEACIRSNIAVFLHGQTGAGKTSRMVSLDDDLEVVNFGCTTADGFMGMVAKDFNTQQLTLYEPYWYKSLCEKCKKEPDKTHILFLDELTNASKNLQKVAFEVILDKRLTTDSGYRLELPKNAVVCAAGNEASESRSATALSEPLYARFAHVYIDTNSDVWLKWARKRKEQGRFIPYKERKKHEFIHPAIYDFIKINGDSVLRTEYDGEKPNTDPRKWEMASDALYECNNPNILRAFIGQQLTDSFVKFCQLNLVSVSEVVEGRTDNSYRTMNASEKNISTLMLSEVDDDNFLKVRDYVSNFGSEYCAKFEYEWAKGSEERILRLYSDRAKTLTHTRG